MVDGAVDRTGELLRGDGEVSERTELLNGTLQLSIEGVVAAGSAVAGSAATDGVATENAAPWELSASFAWRLGRDGDVPLSEGDLTLESSDGELFATLGEGVATVDPDTGAASLRATFIVDGVQGERLADLGLRPNSAVTAELTVDAERWSGELRLPPARSGRTEGSA